MEQKVVISCALTGAGETTGKSPAVPVTPKQIAASAIEAANAGASIVHIHVRDPATTLASMENSLYAEVVELIRQSKVDVIINLTTGPGARYIPGDVDPCQPGEGTTLTTPENRVRHVEMLRPEICSLDMGSMNFGDRVFMNTPKHLAQMAKAVRAAGVKPELEVFDAGQIQLSRHLIKAGVIDSPPLFQICLGISWGAPATPQSLIYLRDLLPPDSNWFAFGISAHHYPVAAQAVLLGGNVRVGLEDNLYIERGKLAAGNGALVEKAAHLIQILGAHVASPSEAREILRLPGPVVVSEHHRHAVG